MTDQSHPARGSAGASPSQQRIAVITIGLGFGDEGKGATVDFLARQLGAELVVRYCGGAQAGHNVELPDGRRHTFSQFGAGTFAGAKTYLGPRMIIAPATMVPEAEHLEQLGITNPFARMSVHPDCLVSTGYHVAMNRLREIARGDDRHGSCGLGIGETRHYWLRYGQEAVFANDLKNRATLIPKLTLLRDRSLLEMQELDRPDASLSEQLHETTPSHEADVLMRASSELTPAREMPDAETIIFEGAQGVLLDEWMGFPPYVTWSTVTPRHALEMIAEAGITDVTTLGLTRAYATRHGDGPFPTFSTGMTASLIDPGNPKNDWQGSIRSGPLDLVLLNYAARICRLDGFVVNALDQLPAAPRLCTRYEGVESLDIPRTFHEQETLTALLQSVVPVDRESTAEEILESLKAIAPVVITANGPTHEDRQLLAPVVAVR